VLSQEDVFVIHDLYRQGVSIRGIARRTGQSRKTIRKYLELGLQARAYGPRAARPSILEPYQDYVQQRLQAFPELTASRLLREIRDLGYPGSYTIVKRLVRDLRPIPERGFEHRFETPPGQQAQVDFAHFKVVFTDEPQQVHVLWLFSMVLGHSRALYGRFVLRQTVSDFLRCHLLAFRAFGGVPCEILYDRLKAAVLGVTGDGEPLFHPQLLNLAAHCGFHPRACRPYRAKTKGKVERPFRYIRQDFFLGREFRNLGDLNDQYEHWLGTVANQRSHGTTGRVVAQALQDERDTLQPFPELPFRNVLRLERRITRDGLVSVDGNLYSVPDTTRRRVVEVHSLAEEIQIYDGGDLVAVHPALEGRGQVRIAAGHRHHPPPGNSKTRRDEVGGLERAGDKVPMRSLEVYESVADVLASVGRSTS
jgi:transposase